MSSQEGDELDIFIKPECSPWSAPLIIFIILVVINIFTTIASVVSIVNNKNGEKIVKKNQQWGAAIASGIVYLVIAFLFAFWLYSLSRNCEEGKAWLVLLLAIFFPFVLFIVIVALVALLLI